MGLNGNTDIVIREATASDLDAVAHMLRNLGRHVGAEPKVTATDLAVYGPLDRQHFEILVAEAKSGIVGIALYSIVFSAWRGRPGIFISDLFVSDAARGQGLGTRLLRTAIAREAPRDCAFVKLDVDRDNLIGIGFYERLGFKTAASDHTMVLEIDGIGAE